MSATVKLESIRFVKRVSNGGSLSKYGYIGMMESLADSIKYSPWVQSNASADAVTLTTNQLTKTDGVFDAETNAWTTLPTYTAYMADIYDCFKQAGDAVSRNATMCGYAGCVAYRFKLPTSETANALNSISLALQRDRYLRAGVRVGLALSDSDMPSDDWSVVRGEATGCVRSESTAPAEGVVGVSSFGFLGQPDVPYLTSSRAASGVLTLDTSTAFAAAASYQYLYLYITLEDPAAYWNLYKETEPRQYYIEGSAMLVADNCTFTFASEPEAAVPTEHVVGYQDVTLSEDYLPDNLNLKPHIVAARDFTFLSTCGAPVCIVKENGVKSWDLNDILTGYTSVESLGKANPKTVGMPNAYSVFYRDNMIRGNGSIMSARSARGSDPDYPLVSASFSVVFLKLDETAEGDFYDAVAIIRKKMLVPFTLPVGYRPNRVRFDWRGYGDSTDYGGIGNVNMRHNVWIAKGDLSRQYSLNVLQRHELYTAEKDSVENFRLVGTFFHKIEKASNGDPDFTKTLDLPYSLDRGPYTILITVFIDQDQITFDSNGLPTQDSEGAMGVLLGGADIMTVAYGLVHEGFTHIDGWSPKITLLA